MAKDEKAPAKDEGPPPDEKPKAISLPDHKDPATARFVAAAKERYVMVKDKPQPVHSFCKLRGCGYPMVHRSNFTGDRSHTDLVCGWDPSHPQG